MAAEITVRATGENEFEVTVREGSSETRHAVTAEPAYVRTLAPANVTTADLLRRSFEFLLEREPKESILSRFHLRQIQRYFPDYEREIRDRLRK